MPQPSGFTDTDARFMARALDLARRGTALASPNPIVGCVIVDQDGNTAGEGWHQYDLRDHAEVVALTQASGVTGIVLTKLDGTAKGGIAVAIARELNLPVRFVGVGEKISDLLEFDPETFVDSLLSN